MQTKRPQNECRQCGHSWYPRGHNISVKCPNCGARKLLVTYILHLPPQSSAGCLGWILFASIVVAGAWFTKGIWIKIFDLL